MTRSKIGRERKQPVTSPAKRKSLLRTLARDVYHRYEDTYQRRLLDCTAMQDGGQGVGKVTCVGAYRKSSSPEAVHDLVLDKRLCKECRASVAFLVASVRLRDIAEWMP